MLKHAAIVPYIPVADVARARKFYEGKLGLEPKEEFAGGVIYECGNGSWVFMYPITGRGHIESQDPCSGALTTSWPKSPTSKRAAWSSRSTDMPGLKTVNGIVTGGGAKTAWFKDSEGNILAVSQRI